MEKEFFIERYEKLGWKFKTPKIKQAIRVNTLKISKENLKKRLLAKGVKLSDIKFSKNGLFIESSSFSVGSTEEYLLGYYYIQGAASQIPAEMLDPFSNDLVLDCCAAPGGKSTQISQIMNNKGVIVALDKKSQRLIALKNNIERMGCSNIITYNMDALDVKKLTLKFDKILLDAPCSGNFTQEAGWFEKRDIEGIKGNAENQKNLLSKCFDVLNPGGILVYSTCSLEPEENEENVDWFLKNYDVKLLEKKRLWPSEETQGFFIAKFMRKK